MSSYLMNPKAPLLFRDGRPFKASDRAETLTFPLPSTVAGALRAAYGESLGLSFAESKEKLLELESHGPLLVGFNSEGTQSTVYFPKPADAVYCKGEQGLLAAHLIPCEVSEAEGGTDLPKGLYPLFLKHQKHGKPADGADFWTLDNTVAWLAAANTDPIQADKLGADALPVEIRTHVGIDSTRLTNLDGALFQTAGLDFGPSRKPNKNHGWEDQSFGLLARFRQPGSEESPLAKGRFRTIGGESRLAWIEATELWPDIPPALSNALENTGWLKLMLATPALFDYGWRPAWLDESTLEGSPPRLTGIKLKLCAVAMERWQPFSGWDLRTFENHKGGASRAVRRLVPAGSVYWFNVLEGNAEILRKLWLYPLSDQPQDCLNGFGLALPGIWSGEVSTNSKL